MINKGVIFTDKQKSLLLPMETEQKYGYKIEDLSFGAGRYIVHKCDICGEPKSTKFREFIKSEKWSHVECRGKKIQQSIFEKYGVKNPAQLESAKAKSKQTCLAKYGVEHSSQAEQKKKKTRETNLQKYGTECSSLNPEVREKRRQTCLERYGVENTASLPEVVIKKKLTLLKKYGVENSFESLEVQEKIKETNLERYGVENPTQKSQNRERLKEWRMSNPEILFSSRAELEILQWVRQCYPNVKKYIDGTHEIDIFISDINLGIEYNGLYWHQEEVLTDRSHVNGQKYHLDKTKHFQEKNIKLIHIFEHEWRDRQEQVKSFLLSAIGKNEYRIGARKCILQWSSLLEDIKEVHNFLENYHIQGQPSNTKYVIKVLYNNELLAVATFGKHHRNNKDWVLTRFCTKTNYTIQGVLSRVSKLASQQLKEDILSWADYRLSQGNGYEKAGWVFEELLPPDYFYHRHGKVISKQSRQKRHAKTPSDMTEIEHARLEGLYRVYDCGKIRYRYKYL